MLIYWVVLNYRNSLPGWKMTSHAVRIDVRSLGVAVVINPGGAGRAGEAGRGEALQDQVRRSQTRRDRARVRRDRARRVRCWLTRQCGCARWRPGSGRGRSRSVKRTVWELHTNPLKPGNPGISSSGTPGKPAPTSGTTDSGSGSASSEVIQLTLRSAANCTVFMLLKKKKSSILVTFMHTRFPTHAPPMFEYSFDNDAPDWLLRLLLQSGKLPNQS